jgi:hypothetical protein
MNKSAVERFGPLTGIVFAALLISFRAVEGSGLPDADESTAEVVKFWTDNQSSQIVVAILASLAGVFFVWFGGVFRGALRDGDGYNETLATLVFGGALIAAGGFFADTTVEFAAADTAGDVPGQVTQTLSALQADTFFGIAAGFAIFNVAAGIAVLRTGLLPRWLGWVSVVTGVLWLTPGQFVAIFLTLLFIVWTSVVLFRHESGAPTTAT